MDWDPPETWNAMAQWLRGVPALIEQPPTALLVISAHWETDTVTVGSNPKPSLIYDYHGFPPHTYEIQWPAPGAPEVASRVQDLLRLAGIESQADPHRGLDHGVFIPLKLSFPQGNVPVVQLSLEQSLDPARHLEIGRALAPLRDEGVVIIGSGMSYHNMQRFQRRGGEADPASLQFDQWLEQAVTASASDRNAALLDWANAPGARESHPREEHLLPLHVVIGAAGTDVGAVAFRDQVMGSQQSAFVFGAQAESAASESPPG